jgi:hypothetical protein
MRHLVWVLFSILFFSLKVGAFEYQIEESSLLHPSALQGHKLTQIFAKKGFRSLSDASLVSTGLPFDKAFVSDNWNKVLLLKAGLKAPANIEGRLIEDANVGVSVIHFQFEGTPYVLVSLNNSRDELRDIVKPWLKSNSSVAGSVAWSMFFPQAHALACPSYGDVTRGLKSTSEYIENNEMFQSIGQCALDAMQGAKSSAENTLGFFKKLVSDPTALWSEMKESFVQLKDFAQNIQAELQQTLETASRLKSEEKLQLACTFAGTVMVGAVQAILSGAAIGRVLPSLLLKVKGTTTMLKKISGLENLGLKFPNKSGMMQEVMSCAF